MDYEVDKKILVLSTMSAGKSTLINALIGNDVFPSSNEACTAKIMTYTSDSRLNKIKATVYGIYTNEYENLKKQDIEILNTNSEFKRVEFYGPIHSDTNKDIKVKFIDTPGVNNSQDISHEKITYEALEKEDFDTILYILNVTQLGIDDDALLLAKLKSYIKNNKYKDVVFVLNKIDEIDTEKECLEEIYQNAIIYISKNTGISNPQIVCISAYYANLIKKKINNNEMTRKELRDISFFNTEDEQYNKYNNLIQLKKVSYSDQNDLINKTGILNLENYLFDSVNREELYINIYDKLLKIKSLTRLKKYDESILKDIFNCLKNNNLLSNEYKAFKCYLENLSKLNSKEAKVLCEILQEYDESTIISSIVKSLKYASNSFNKNKFIKFEKILNEISESIEIDEKITSLELIDFIIEDLLYYMDVDTKKLYKDNKKQLKFNKEEYDINITENMIVEKNEVIRLNKKIINIKSDINIKGKLTFNNCTINIKYKTINLLNDSSHLQINNSYINLYKAKNENINIKNKSKVSIKSCTINTFINTIHDKSNTSIINKESEESKLNIDNCIFYKNKDLSFL